MRGRGLKCRKFVLSYRPLEATESILQYFLHAKFSDFSKKMDFFIIPLVSRAFDHTLLNYGPHPNKLTKSWSGVPWIPIFSPSRLQICGRDRASFDLNKMSGKWVRRSRKSRVERPWWVVPLTLGKFLEEHGPRYT